jgi:hypothetical protein
MLLTRSAGGKTKAGSHLGGSGVEFYLKLGENVVSIALINVHKL